jgi:hypothetical protein
VKLVDLDQTIFIPVVDESKGGVEYEMKMTVGEFFRKFCKGFELDVVEAIPVEWIDGWRQDAIKRNDGLAKDMLDWLLGAWQKEQEAR